MITKWEERRRKYKMRLRHRLYITLLTVSLIPLVLCALVMLYQNTQNVEKVIRENLLGVSQSQIDNIEDFCEQVKQDMEVMSQYSFLQQEILANLNYIHVPDTARTHLEEILKAQTDYQPYIQSLIIVDKNLRVVAASENYIKGKHSGLGKGDTKFLSGEFCISNVYTRETNEGKKQAVMAYQGIFYEDELIGYIVQEILTSHFDKYRNNDVLWENAVLQIRDGKGALITIGGDGEEKPSFLEKQELHDQQVDKKRLSDGFEKEGSLEYGLFKEKYITCYSKLQYTDWIIRITVNVDAYVQAGMCYLALFVAVGALGILMMMVVNYFITAHTVRPIEEIRQVLKQVQQTQDYSLRIETSSRDEMGELQHEVNRLLQCVMEAQMQDKKEQKSLEKKAEKDPMTGVMNKKAIGQRVQQMIEENVGRDVKLAVGFVDIDDFRDYNTKYGHAEGDHVIKFVANTLRETIPGSIGRNGGDEFVFCMETDGCEFVEQTMELLWRKLKTGVVNSVTDERMPIPCSIGIVVEQPDNTDYCKFIQDADEAMYEAKGKGKNTYHIITK